MEIYKPHSAKVLENDKVSLVHSIFIGLACFHSAAI
jgi:hypothetical protein